MFTLTVPHQNISCVSLRRNKQDECTSFLAFFFFLHLCLLTSGLVLPWPLRAQHPFPQLVTAVCRSVEQCETTGLMHTHNIQIKGDLFIKMLHHSATSSQKLHVVPLNQDYVPKKRCNMIFILQIKS